jgi:hypothetical protein
VRREPAAIAHERDARGRRVNTPTLGQNTPNRNLGGGRARTSENDAEIVPRTRSGWESSRSLVGLDSMDVNLDAQPPYLRPRITKSGKPRSIPLSKASVNVLPLRPAEGGPVFRGSRGAPLQNLQRAWRKARIRAGLPKTRFHDLRHEWASRFVESGGDVRALMEVGGWGSLALVARYSHSNLVRVAETMERASTGGSKAEKSKVMGFMA